MLRRSAEQYYITSPVFTIVYGAVTTGTDWKFLKLVDQRIFIDINGYYVKEVDKILGILASTFQSEYQSES